MNSTGKPVKPEDLRKIETIVNEQIKDALDVFSKETRLADAKRVNGLRAVFGEVIIFFLLYCIVVSEMGAFHMIVLPVNAVHHGFLLIDIGIS